MPNLIIYITLTYFGIRIVKKIIRHKLLEYLKNNTKPIDPKITTLDLLPCVNCNSFTDQEMIIHYNHKGKTIYFCSLECKEQFLKNYYA